MDKCNSDDRFLSILKKSKRKSKSGRSIIDIYNEYLSQQRSKTNFNIDCFASEFILNVDRKAWLDVDVSGILKVKEQKIQANYFEGSLRQNFTIAHEIAHYLLHSCEEDEKIDYSYKRSQTYPYTEKQRIEEEEADFFAANILMPEQLLRQLYEENKKLSLEKLVQTLAESFQVSGRAMVKRLKYLGIINHWVWINI